MGKVSHGVDCQELTQVKLGIDFCFDDSGPENAKNWIKCANASSCVRIREAINVEYRKLEGAMPRSVFSLRVRFRPPFTDLPVAVGFMKPEMEGWGKHPIAFAIIRGYSIVVRYAKGLATQRDVRRQAKRGLYEERILDKLWWSQLNPTVFYYEQHKRFKS